MRHWPTVALTYAIGAGGAALAKAVHMPMPLMSGSLIAVGAAAIAGVRPFGALLQAPQGLRMIFVPVIGVSIGAAFTPEVLAALPRWLLSLALVSVYVPLVHALCYRLTRRAGVAPHEAFFGTAPGGMVETVEMAAEAGADAALVTLLQFLRAILTILLVPLAFSILTGHPVGSAAGLRMPGSPVADWQDAALLFGCGAVGAWLGLKLRLPAGLVFGPLLASLAVHAAGLTQAGPPAWLVGVTQVVIGTTLAVRFAGMPPRRVVLGARLASVNVAVALAVAGAFALLLPPLVGEPWGEVFLAFSPGGLVEMGLVALSLGTSVIFVTAHHLVRIVLAVVLARLFRARIAP